MNDKKEKDVHMNRKFFALALMVPALAFGVAACSSDDSGNGGGDTTTEATTEEQNIVGVAAATPELSTLVEAITAADLGATLEGDGPFTVFAPTNKAFEQLPAGELDRLLKPANKDELTNILTYHVAGQKALSADLTDGQQIPTVQGGKVTVKIDGEDVKINGATVSTADVPASNGGVHIVDTVLIPKN